jgi:aspartyl-tRNA(Asn)/glutamyl-tRNA(Gln) amidotransferase subunit A
MISTPGRRETLVATHEELVTGKRSAEDLVRSCLDRIRARDPVIQAWALVEPESALSQARACDARRTAGEPLGPLHGIPLGIKDIIDVKGWPTTAGFGPWADRIALKDAPVISTLKAAGAVILGKTVTTCFAWIDPPATRNPWNLDRTPGGSSSGSAVAVADGMCLGALGTQTGGSITRPATYCGVCGMKPSFGSVDLSGIVPLAPSLDHVGPIAGTVEDLTRLWEVLSGIRPIEPRLQPPRLGRLGGLFENQAEPEMRFAFDQALTQLRSAGADLLEPATPEPFQAIEGHFRAMLAYEAAPYHRGIRARFGKDYPPRIQALVEEGLAMTEESYLRARQHQAGLRVAFLSVFDQVDALVTPATPGPAPDRSTTGSPAFNLPWSYLGWPTVSLPIGWSSEGLPLAIQLVGRPDGDNSLLALAAWCEQRIRVEPRLLTESSGPLG